MSNANVRTPLVRGGGGRSISSSGGTFHASINEVPDDISEANETGGVDGELAPWDEEPTKNNLGTINGVYVPCLLNILGAVLFMRIGYSVGYAGWLGTVLIFLFSELITIMTALSFSKIVTNGKMGGGGAYYMISRSIGAPFGAATGVLFYLCYVANCAFNCSAFVEDIVTTFLPDYSDPLSKYSLILYHGTMFVLMLIGVAGAGAFSKINVGLFVFLFMAILMTFGSLLFMDERSLETLPANGSTACKNMDALHPNNFTGDIMFHPPTPRLFRENFWWVGHSCVYNGVSQPCNSDDQWDKYTNNMMTVLALVFTSTCGVMEGANLSGDLKDPAKSLPLGTLAAKTTSFTTYIIFTTFCALCFDRNALQCEYLVLQKAAISQYFVIIGIAMATLSTSLGALFGAARILQAIAHDDIFPIGYFKKGSKIGNEPRRAVVATWVLVNGFAYLGGNSVNAIGAILTDFFLCAYALVNMSQFFLTLSAAPNYRPTFKYATWYTSLFAFVLGTALMWFLNWKYAAMTWGAWLVIFIYVTLTVGEKDWGDIGQGLLYRGIVKNLKDLVQRKDNAKFWRSSVIVLAQDQDLPLLTFCKHMTKDGLFIVATAMLGDEQRMVSLEDSPAGGGGGGGGLRRRKRTLTNISMLPKHNGFLARTKAAWLWLVEQNQLGAFVAVGSGVNLLQTFRTMISSAGLGGLVPNTVVVPFRDSTGPPRRVDYVQRVEERLGTKVADRRRAMVARRQASKSTFPACCDASSTCEVCNSPTSYNSVLGFDSNLQYVQLLKTAMEFEKNLMVLRNTSGMEATFQGMRQKQTVRATWVDIWIVGELDFDVDNENSLDESITLLIQHAHLMKQALGNHANLRIVQLVHFFFDSEELKFQAKLNELMHLARIPLPEILVVPAPQQPKSEVENESSWVSNGNRVSSAQFSNINSMIAAHSKDTSCVFLAMPGLPDEASVESSDAYMAGIESLTQGLPCTTALLMKGDPAPVLSTHI